MQTNPRHFVEKYYRIYRHVKWKSLVHFKIYFACFWKDFSQLNHDMASIIHANYLPILSLSYCNISLPVPAFHWWLPSSIRARLYALLNNSLKTNPRCIELTVVESCRAARVRVHPDHQLNDVCVSVVHILLVAKVFYFRPFQLPVWIEKLMSSYLATPAQRA